eukprot:CAMPEP_0114343766 /NCGR_PEP_ID=MMETSP0101-20121206/10869_1 /TAXON_ID=38822 ORGANISM="Pteridomonas danica, Strain PT" /NCGR_SAMPLE_ID=MMETSP0101 /ASSEMBLY_ACC=CAM_ASM_000211 /LENGTH=31 /DNA_ID= /DNA_START= /DNA_END= /DNA_ORIENTATION=
MRMVIMIMVSDIGKTIGSGMINVINIKNHRV